MAHPTPSYDGIPSSEPFTFTLRRPPTETRPRPVLTPRTRSSAKAIDELREALAESTRNTERLVAAAIASLREDLVALRADNVALCATIAAIIAAALPPTPSALAPADAMDVDVANATPSANSLGAATAWRTPRNSLGAPPRAAKRGRDLATTTSSSSPPATTTKVARLTSPPHTLMHSKHAGPSTPAAKPKGPAAAAKPTKGARADEPAPAPKQPGGWTTVERKRRGGSAVPAARGATTTTTGTTKPTRKPTKVIVRDTRGYTSYISTPTGTLESWRPGTPRSQGEPRRERR